MVRFMCTQMYRDTHCNHYNWRRTEKEKKIHLAASECAHCIICYKYSLSYRANADIVKSTIIWDYLLHSVPANIDKHTNMRAHIEKRHYRYRATLPPRGVFPMG